MVREVDNLYQNRLVGLVGEVDNLFGRGCKVCLDRLVTSVRTG
jgi:hypothetical protein